MGGADRCIARELLASMSSPKSLPKIGIHGRFLSRFAGVNQEAWGTIDGVVEDFAKTVSRVL